MSQLNPARSQVKTHHTKSNVQTPLKSHAVDDTAQSPFEPEKIVEKTQTMDVEDRVMTPHVPSEKKVAEVDTQMISVTANPKTPEISKQPDKPKVVPSKPVKKASSVIKAKKLAKKSSNSKLGPELEPDDDDEGSYSENIVVMQTDENEIYLNRVIIGKLSRLGLRKTLWTTKAQSFFVIFSFLLSYQSVVSFTYSFDTYGPMFLLPFMLLVIFFAIPAMYFEMSLGQYTSSTVITLFERMSPALMGIGISAIAFNYVYTISDEMIIPQFWKLFMHSVQILSDEMPYHHCSNVFNTEECRSLVHPSCDDLNRELEEKSRLGRKYREDTGLRYMALGDLCVQSRLTAIQQETNHPIEFDKMGFDKWMQALSHNQFTHEGFDFDNGRNLYFPTFNVLFVHCFAWFVVYYVCQQSQKFILTMTKIAMLLALSAFLTLLVAVLFFKPPQYPLLASLDTNGGWTKIAMWLDAFTLVLRLFKIGQGGYIYLGAQNDIHNPILPDCFIIAAVMTALPVLYAILHLFIIDSHLLGVFKGDRDRYQVAANNAFDHDIYRSGNQLIHFSVLSMSLSSLGSYESFVLAIFSFAALLVVVTNKIVHIEMITTTIMEHGFESEDHSLVLTAVIFACALGTMIFQGAQGFQILISIDNLLLPVLGAVIFFFEVVAIIIYGPHRFFANLMFICNRRNTNDKWRRVKQYINVVLLFLVLGGAPIVVVAPFVRYIILQDHYAIMWFFILFLAAGIIGIVPAIAYIRMSAQYYKSSDFWGLFIPNRDLWGPRSRADREIAEIVERELRFRGFRNQLGHKKKKNKKRK